VINVQQILYYRAVVNLVTGIFTASHAMPCPQTSGHFTGQSSVGVTGCGTVIYVATTFCIITLTLTLAMDCIRWKKQIRDD